MAGFFEGVDKALTNLSQSPVGMAGMGLLMMPSQSLTPINPWQYAAEGMQMGAQNRQRAQAMQALQERQRQEDEYRQMQYLMQAQKYQQEMLKQAEAQRRAEEQRAAEESYFSTFSPEEQILARAGGKDFIKAQIQSRFPGASGATATDIQLYEMAKSQGFKGSLIDYQKLRAGMAANAYANAAYGKGLGSEAGKIAGQYESRAQAAEAARAREEGVMRGRAQGEVSMAPEVAQAEASKQAQILAAKEQEQRRQNALAAIGPLERKAEESITLLNEFMNHPGFESFVGSGIGKAASIIPGTDASGAKAIWENIQAKNYLSSIEAFRGFGQLSNTEGAAAAKAYSDMSAATSEQDFMKAAQRFYNHYVLLIEAARKEAGVNNGAP